MKKIDPETTRRILDAADIVEVVSDFVSLKRRGVNYIGLCPFHSERTPSFSVSKSRGICKCFSCGKGGSPVNFLMELESMSYQEALRWLARKYNIEIKEREETEQERQATQERESLLAVNDWAMRFFQKYMLDTPEGRNIGKSYFQERGLNDRSLETFHLGFSPERGNLLLKEAQDQGFSDDLLVKAGLCARRGEDGQGELYDRFRGRVIYPVFTLSGRVVAFGGRTLRSDKQVAKYVNSPETVIYSKSRELYGLYQARQAITRQDKCILVEGYMDVISMYQRGVENVVASSGTSLTDGQIRLIHRFTHNVTVVYDADAAGIKASLRGIDMLLAQGMNVKTLRLPPGEDPDSYAQSHSKEEIEEYFREHETDFIRFKMDILLADGAKNDPVLRAQAITSILKSVAVIPDLITRQTYLDECSRQLEMDQKILARQLAVYIAGNLEEADKQERLRTQTTWQTPAAGSQHTVQQPFSQTTATEQTASGTANVLPENTHVTYLRKYERELLRYALRYGMVTLCDALDDNGDTVPMSVLEYIEGELNADSIEWQDGANGKLWNAIHELVPEWQKDEFKRAEEVDNKVADMAREERDKIRENCCNMQQIDKAEKLLQAKLEQFTAELRTVQAKQFLVMRLISHPDNEVRHLATILSDDKYVLSKVHTKYGKVETEEDRLISLVPRSVYELKNAILNCTINDVQARLRQQTSDGTETAKVLEELMELNRLKADFAKYLGDRTITPRR